MPKTERLYYSDCYLRAFEARVLRVESAPRGFRVYLDRTAFYPESGGQPSDHGSLDGIPLLEALDEGDEIAHVLASSPQKENVTGNVDWRRRFDHMQQHTGQHLLSAAFERTGSYRTASFRMGAETSTVDLDSDRIGRRQIEEAEDLANQVVFDNRSVRIFFQPAEVAQGMDLRKPTLREGEVRLVQVEGFDLSPCGGTHVKQTGAVGMIAVRRFERLKGLTRVEFVCGYRALRLARSDFLVLSEGARLFSTGLESVPGLITKQAQELRDVLRARDKLVERLAEFQALELWRDAPEQQGHRIVQCVFPAEDVSLAKMVAHKVGKQPSAIALIAVKSKPTAMFFSQSAGGEANMASVLKQTMAKFGGKGGGTQDFAQGGDLDESRLEEALAYAQGLAR
jgi:alanyl-tRNA synthetase